MIDHWVIAGHSVGGTMAAQFAYKNPILIDGLMIWASYSANSSDLSESDISVISVFGSDAPGVSDAEIDIRKELLPISTTYIRIEGGDHHQFGSYQIKAEEDFASIPRESQHEQIIEETLIFLNSIK